MEDTSLRRKSREDKKAKSYEGGSYKGRLYIQDKPRLNKRFSTQSPTKFPMARDDSLSIFKSQNGRGTSSPSRKPTCGKRGKKHCGDCLVGTDNFFGCGKIFHKIRYCLNVKRKDKGSMQSQTSGSIVDSPKKNHFYALPFRGEQESSPDVVTDMLHVFSLMSMLYMIR